MGGVGIMNIMLANVRARIREIGIRKALGATYREIKLQFLAEAVIISLTGGLVGMLVGLTSRSPSAFSPTTLCPSRGCPFSSRLPPPPLSASSSALSRPPAPPRWTRRGPEI